MWKNPERCHESVFSESTNGKMDCYISGTDSKVLPGCSKTANDKVISTQSIPEPMGPLPINTVIMLVTRWCTLQITVK